MPPADDQATASVHVWTDQTDDASVLPSQLLTLEVLRQPLESTQYLSICYTERLAEAGVEPSVGSIGDSYDNSLVEYATLEWVDWFNTIRLLGPIGDTPPAEHEANYYRQTSPAEEAGLTPTSLR